MAMQVQRFVLCSIFLAGFCCFSHQANAQDVAKHDGVNTGSSVQIPDEKIPRVKTGIVQHGGEILIGPAYGDVQNGHHGTFLYFPANWSSLEHTHTFDYYAVVIKGTIQNPRVGETDAVKLGPGSYWYQKGGEPHWTKCVSKEPCTVFLVSEGKFDAQVLEKE
ncbi:DUF4437 domain-containing protein [Acidipila sp. EB88]|uniref:DUF4437 domain-containing protein n=1 Tax=Acidipila sp. EB88 TaxID=2305226 RepID=UPI000F600640|nr:DUF4437 domain-containing protein [Acidipila sp. EB88]RRA49294.1 DUF4437 domain-containing protein [Acidipila sp. EB88]